MTRSGALEPVTRRKMLSTQTLYMPNNETQRNAAAWAPMRLANLLVRGMELSMSDRVLVMNGGRMVAHFDRDQVTPESVVTNGPASVSVEPLSV